MLIIEDNSRFIMILARNSEFSRVLISFLPSCLCVECWVACLPRPQTHSRRPGLFVPGETAEELRIVATNFYATPPVSTLDLMISTMRRIGMENGFRRIQRWPGPTSDWWEEAGQPAAGSDLDRLQGSGARWEWVPGIVHTLATTWPVHSQLQPGQLDPWTLDLGPAWG